VYPLKEEKMNITERPITNEPSVTAPARCQHRTLKGRCRQLATDPAGLLCFDHARAAKQAQNDFTLLAPLVRKPEDFQSAQTINEILGALHNLLAEGRISPRRAAIIAYVDSLILRTFPAIDRELNPKPGKDEPVQIIFDMPGPERDKIRTPEPTYADLRT
jgi:hypothetical protein